MDNSTIENMMMSSSNTPSFNMDDFKNMMKPGDMIQMVKVQLNIMESAYENVRKHINWLLETSKKYDMDIPTLEDLFARYKQQYTLPR